MNICIKNRLKMILSRKNGRKWKIPGFMIRAAAAVSHIVISLAPLAAFSASKKYS
jgi:hypothetical protein